MAKIQANGIDIEYQVMGDAAAPPLLLISGLGMQLISYQEEFCAALASRGFRVIRYDNRDVGLSTKFEHLGVPDFVEALNKHARGESGAVPYTLADMADDAAGLLDALGIAAAHVVGASMGGAIGQTLAIRHPERVLSLTSIMSGTGESGMPSPKPEAIGALLRPAPAERTSNIEAAVEMWRLLSGGGFPFDEPSVRDFAARAYDRSFYPQGVSRQVLAVAASGSRREALAKVRVQTLIIHGSADPLSSVEGGIATHEAIRESELMIINGMGHELPVGAWPQIIDGIVAVAARAAPVPS